MSIIVGYSNLTKVSKYYLTVRIYKASGRHEAPVHSTPLFLSTVSLYANEWGWLCSSSLVSRGYAREFNWWPEALENEFRVTRVVGPGRGRRRRRRRKEEEEKKKKRRRRKEEKEEKKKKKRRRRRRKKKKRKEGEEKKKKKKKKTKKRRRKEEEKRKKKKRRRRRRKEEEEGHSVHVNRLDVIELICCSLKKRPVHLTR
jgi:hypothetical protein